MPKRVLDFDAMWGSDKLASCASWAQAEYAWLYGLADASGCFELTNLRVIWGRVAAIRGNLTIERLEQVFAEFQDKGLLFVWEHEGKRYAHWTGSDVPGRLPPPSWRMRLERFAPPVPKQRLAEYMARFARGRAALAGVGFRGEAQREEPNRKENCKFEISDLREEQGVAGRAQGSQRIDRRAPGADCGFENSDLKEEQGHDGRVASLQRSEQRELFADRGEERGDRNSHLKPNGGAAERFGNSGVGERRAPGAARELGGMAYRDSDVAERSGLKGRVEEGQAQDLGLDWNLNGNLGAGREERRDGQGDAAACSGGANREREINRNNFCNSNSFSNSYSHSNSEGKSVKELAVARELRVGQGPVCGPTRVRPEVLERVRRRDAARAGSRSS
ncbi:MAG TPA: hypothetical protein VN976_00115 [Verrucomicrobiae bacterium]|nr:hypothetical protein [Verrucomicrobiae bacterium]